MNQVTKEIINTLVYLLVVFVLTFLFITFVAQRTEVSGSSMEPTLQDRDSLLVDKMTYRFSNPKRFDVIIFPYKYGNNQYFIKRVIGLPGETVNIDYEGNIYINGNKLDENYGAEVIADPGRAYEEIVLGDNEFFVMGDNRNASTDSRRKEIGMVDERMILGKVYYVVFPMSDFGAVM